MDFKVLGPLTRDVVQNFLLLASRVEGGRERVLLSRDPALAGIVDLGGVPGGGGDVRRALQLDKRRSEEEAFDVKSGKGDEICVCWPTSRVGDCQDSVSDLFDVDRLREAGLLRVVALKVDTGRDVRDAVGSRRRMVASNTLALSSREVGCGCSYLTCSLINSVVPASSSHFPRNSSPKKGLRGFFSFPYCSLRLAYCCLRVVKNHFNTRRARFLGSASFAGAAKMAGCSHQYDENSVKLVEERIKGGAVRLARSPLNEAIDYESGPC
jgi:hypothetical protein